MRTASQRPEDALAAVREAIPAVSAELAADLLHKSQQSVTLSHTAPVQLPQTLYAPEATDNPRLQGNPEFAAYPSRVGFNASRTQALVYLGVVNWADSAKSLGQYLYLKKAAGNWIVLGRFRVWELIH